VYKLVINFIKFVHTLFCKIVREIYCNKNIVISRNYQRGSVGTRQVKWTALSR